MAVTLKIMNEVVTLATIFTNLSINNKVQRLRASESEN